MPILVILGISYIQYAHAVFGIVFPAAKRVYWVRTHTTSATPAMASLYT